MCGIVTYVCAPGRNDALDVVLDALSRLEHRGYDSAGVGTLDVARPNMSAQVTRREGRLWELRRAVDKPTARARHVGTVAVGHTRWATHGVPSITNAHPHRAGPVTLVHNGVVDNAFKLRVEFESKGVELVSDTDTELLTHLVAHGVCDDVHRRALRGARTGLDATSGRSSFSFLLDGRPDVAYCARRGSPMVIAHVPDVGTFACSDVVALRGITGEVFDMRDDDIAELRPDGFTVWNAQDDVVEVTMRQVEHVEEATRAGYTHWMYKELLESPDAVDRTLRHLSSDDVTTSTLETLTKLRYAGELVLTGCGTALNACNVARSVNHELWSPIDVHVHNASELKNERRMSACDVLVAVTQSGETADVLETIKLSKEKYVGSCVAVCNVPGSTACIEATTVLATQAGTEVSVASTKAFACQAALLSYVLCRHAMKEAAEVDAWNAYSTLEKFEDELEPGGRLVQALQRTLHMCHDPTVDIADATVDDTCWILVGTGAARAAADEGALKLKETCYVHAHSLPAGELKHGTIALVETGTPVVGLCTPRDSARVEGALSEVKARGARTLLVVEEGEAGDEVVDRTNPTWTLRVGRTHHLLFPIVAAAALQLLAYHLACAKEIDPDRPRNLAKCVTVL